MKDPCNSGEILAMFLYLNLGFRDTMRPYDLRYEEALKEIYIQDPSEYYKEFLENRDHMDLFEVPYPIMKFLTFSAVMRIAMSDDMPRPPLLYMPLSKTRMGAEDLKIVTKYKGADFKLNDISLWYDNLVDAMGKLQAGGTILRLNLAKAQRDSPDGFKIGSLIARVCWLSALNEPIYAMAP